MILLHAATKQRILLPCQFILTQVLGKTNMNTTTMLPISQFNKLNWLIPRESLSLRGSSSEVQHHSILNRTLVVGCCWRCLLPLNIILQLIGLAAFRFRRLTSRTRTRTDLALRWESSFIIQFAGVDCVATVYYVGSNCPSLS